jgi:hypothetical protein
MIDVDLKGYKEAMDLFDPKRIRKVVNRTVYRTAKTVKTRASRKIREGYALKKSEIDDKMKVIRGDMQAQIKVSGKNLNAIQFGAVSWDRSKPGATVHIKRGRGKMIAHSFQIPKFGNKVFKRVGKKRWDILPVVGPSAKQLVGDAVIEKVIQDTLDDVLQKNFDQQLKFATGADMDLGDQA